MNSSHNQASIRCVELDDIQLLRYWRNLDQIRQKMVFTDCLDRMTQRKWFKKLNNEKERYFIYSIGMRDIGCVNLGKIDFSSKTFEGGIFCGDLSYSNHWINVWACITLYNYAFNDLGFSTAYATILTDNKPALRLNKSLGYKFVKHSDEGVGRFILERSQYLVNSQKIMKYLRVFAKQDIGDMSNANVTQKLVSITTKC